MIVPITPYYSDSSVTIYHADCREILSAHQFSCDCVITDPPWGLGELQGTTSKQRNRNSYASFDDDEENVISCIIPLVVSAIQSCGGRGLVFCGVRCMFKYPQPRAVGGFYQPAAVGMSPWGFAGYNPVLFYGKDPRDGRGQSSVMSVLTEGPSCKDHPCSKPLKAMTWAVGKGTLDGESILDPFMGSGTTLRAAKDMGRKAIGIEIEERYCEIAADRCRQEVMALEFPISHHPKQEELDLGKPTEIW